MMVLGTIYSLCRISAEVAITLSRTSYTPEPFVMGTMISVILIKVVAIVHCGASRTVTVTSSIVRPVVVGVATMMVTIVATIPTV